jgi:Tol biopolymer transport system component
MPIAGGEPERVAAETRGIPIFSPDGKYFSRSVAPHRLEIVAVEGARVIRALELPANSDYLKWAPSSDALTFMLEADGVTNIWRMPIDGRPAQQVTRLRAGQLRFQFAWLGDGSRIVFERIEEAPSEVLLVRNFR